MRWLGCLFLWGFLVSTAASSWAGEDCKQFANGLRQEMVDIIHDEHRTFLQKHTALTALFSHAMDMDAIAQYAAGEYWDKATSPQRIAYFKAYSAYLPDFYISNFNEEDLNGIIDVAIDDIHETSPQHYIAQTRITQKYDETIQAEFQLVAGNGGCRIHDFKADGVSMMDMQREQIYSLGEKGGLPYITGQLVARPGAK